MKKQLKNFMLITLMMILSAGFTSCGDDEDEFSLVGKTYAACVTHIDSGYFGGFYYDGYDMYWVYKFTSETQCELSTREDSPTGGIIGNIEKGTYTLDYPTITISIEGYNVMKGTFVDNKTIRYETKERVLEFIRQ